MELLRLLGHEHRKEGEKENYQQIMMEADEVHTKNRVEFGTEGKTELDICFEHCAESINIFEDLGMIESKESILSLKNFGQ